MSLNHKRRIFRPLPGAVLRRLVAGLPAPSVVVAAIGGALSVLAAAWLFVGSSDAPAHAPPDQHITAPADRLQVIDGDTMRVGDHVVRLRGIAAPARGTGCLDPAGAAIDCGVNAANALAALVRGVPLDCDISGHDAASRPVADCRSRGINLSEALVRQGWARAQPGQDDLRQPQSEARDAHRGLWHDR